MWALIVDGRVLELTEIDPTGRFHPTLCWVKCDVDVEVGMTFDGLSFTIPEYIEED